MYAVPAGSIKGIVLVHVQKRDLSENISFRVKFTDLSIHFMEGVC